ncbi:fam-a protein [Plasmodium chabaudi chabaudi]|uniref:Fam-a protein n=1 Tax=Plasmodium chabaudi chabaudi TaxID=31271 RepID=A0A1D3L9L7_PLACU|nr:fam-a protein [Plasmodium chabaudi chabaudi]
MNKFYIQIVFFLLSVSVYLNNKTLATESAPREVKKTKRPKYYLTPEQLFAKNEHLLYNNPKETKEARNVMSEAVAHLKDYATIVKGYEEKGSGIDYDMFFYKKYDKDNIIVDKIIGKIDDQDKYEPTIHKLWDPDIISFVEQSSVKTKFVRVYDDNLVILQQRYKNWFSDRDTYFYALATKVEISKDTSIIAMTSANINDHHPSEKKYKNKIVKSANLFKTDIDSEDDIRNGKLEKAFVHLAGYYIHKHNDHVDVTFIASIDGRRYT